MGNGVGVGISKHRDPRRAGKQAAEMALQAAGCEKPFFAFVFATVGYPQRALIQSIRDVIGQAPLCGCSGEGVIGRCIADESNFSVGVMAVGRDDLVFSHGLATGLGAGSEAVGREVGNSVAAYLGGDAAALFVLGDGLTINFDAFQRGLEAAIGPKVHLPILGGVSADNWAFKQTYQYCDNRVASDGLAWAMLRGNVRVLSAVSHGCVPIGGKRTITRAHGNVIQEIDGRPALEVLKEYLLPEEIDNWDRAVISLCLGFKTPTHLAGYDEYMIRFIPARNEASCSISIQTEVPAGGDVWMTRRDPSKMEAGVNRVAHELSSLAAGEQPLFVLQFDCCGRGRVILSEPAKLGMLQELQRSIGPEAPWLGLYTLGEIGPIGLHNCFHNYTVVLAAVYGCSARA